ncbi:class I SAM-dependent methyltransferase [Candidatus Gracilibacteria bacterium]|nr:class I SAM-dependent methyltransferase [Candidatus Gracilibacteria bacterium]
MLRNILLKSVLEISKFFPKKNHPFNNSKNGIFDLNYSTHEFESAPGLEKLFSKNFDFESLKDKKILDIGCGGGGKGVYFALKYSCLVYGIDTSKNFISQANSIAKEKGVLDNCFFTLGDAHKMDFGDDFFDLILLHDVIEHIPDTAQLLRESFRVLKPGGKILINFAPYYEIFGHHLWDTLPIPWLHVFFSDKFLIDLYKLSVKNLPDKEKRIDLRIGKNNKGNEAFTYLNKITKRKFQKILNNFIKSDKFLINYQKQYFLKNLNFLSKIPFLDELRARLWVIILEKK